MSARRKQVVIVFESSVDAAEALGVTTGAIANARAQGYRVKRGKVLRHIPWRKP